MKKLLKVSLLRTLIPIIFIVLTVAGTVWHLGWGTLSSFGWREIAALCPLGALETMLADKTVLPRALAALVVFFVLTVIFGRFFCGWLCPVPSVSALLRFLRNGTQRRRVEQDSQGERVAAGADTEEATTSSEKKLELNDLSNARVGSCNSSCSGCSGCSAGQKVKDLTNKKAGQGSAGPLTVLAGALASSAFFGFPVFCLICPVGLTFALVIALSRLFQFNESGWAVLIFAAFLIIELVVLRRWCHNFCPLGALIGLMSRLNRLFVPRINPKACVHVTHGVDCRICVDACPEGIDLRSGSLSAEQIAHCLKCRACAQACPSKAVDFPLLKSSPFAAVRPMPERSKVEILSVSDRVKNYEEVRRPISLQEAINQSSRCLRCGRCTAVCPQGNQIAQWMTLLCQGDVEAAARLMLREGAMPEVCGRICPSDRFCEQVCSMQEASGAVMIADIERAVSQYALDHGYQPAIRRARRPVRVAVVGAGPAGMACADYLARRGVRVVVYERQKEIGGLLAYGIPPFKLSRSVVSRRRRILNDLGVELITDTVVGKDIDFASIRSQNDAVFVATGAGVPVGLSVSGKDLGGVMPAMRLLQAVSCRALGEVADVPHLKGKRVVVLGGGDTAVDCLRSALREGAAEAVAVARKPREQLRAAESELTLALQEGARMLCNREVKCLVGQSGMVQSVIVADAHGHESELPADVVFVAYGFRTEPIDALVDVGVAFDDDGRIRVDENNESTAKNVYAGGDAVRGSYLVAAAIADGRKAAQAILRQCSLD